MPVTKSAAKALRRDKRRQVINRRLRVKIKLAIDSVRKGDGDKEALTKVYSVLDRAAKRGVVHPNKAARLKSRLTKFVSLKMKQTKAKPTKKRASSSKSSK